MQMETFGQTLLASEKACKTVYKSIIKKRPPLLKARENGCLRKMWTWTGTIHNCLPFLCTTETKLWLCQFMFLHRWIATNDFLFKIGLKQAESCFYCGEFTETLASLFWYFQVHSKLLERNLSIDNSKHYLKQTNCLLSSYLSWTNW